MRARGTKLCPMSPSSSDKGQHCLWLYMESVRARTALIRAYPLTQSIPASREILIQVQCASD